MKFWSIILRWVLVVPLCLGTVGTVQTGPLLASEGFEFSRPSFNSTPTPSASSSPPSSASVDQAEGLVSLWLQGLPPEGWTSAELLLTGFSLLGASLIATVYVSWLKERGLLEQHNDEIGEQLKAMEAELGGDRAQALKQFGLQQLRERAGELEAHGHSHGGLDVLRPLSQLERDLAEAVEVLKLYEKLYLKELFAKEPSGESMPAWDESAAFLSTQGWWPSQRRVESQTMDTSSRSTQNILVLLQAMHSQEQAQQALQPQPIFLKVKPSCGSHCSHDHHHSVGVQESSLEHFFSEPLVRKFKENLLARSALWTVRSVKVLLWDYGLKPLHQSLTHPHQSTTRILTQSRVARNENALNAYVGGALGFSLFWAYEAIIHGLLHIHFMCNHAFQYSMAMATAGAMLSPIHYIKESFSLFRNRLSLWERQKLVWSLRQSKAQARSARKNLWLGSKVINQREFMRDHHSHGLWDNFVDQIKLSPSWFLLLQQNLTRKSPASQNPTHQLTSRPSSHQQVVDLQTELELEILSLQKSLSTMALLKRFASTRQVNPALDTLGQLKKALHGLEDLLHLALIVGAEFESLSGGLSANDLEWIEEQIRWQLHQLRRVFFNMYTASEEEPLSNQGLAELKGLSRKLNRVIRAMQSGSGQQALQAQRTSYQEQQSVALNCADLLE